LVKIAPVAVIDDDDGEIFNNQLPQGFGAKFRISYHPGLFDMFGQERCGAPDGGAVDGPMLLQSSFDLGRPRAFADYAFQP
jgi:hypothetical protein